MYLCAVIVLVTGTLLALLFIYEDDVKAIMVAELNKRLKAEVRIEPKNIGLTIIKTFPDCSIEFKNVLMLEARKAKKRDTLFFAGQLNLHFDISNLWNKKYEIKSVQLKNAIVRPTVFKDGSNNYMFWREGDSTSKRNDSIKFNVDFFRIENCSVTYRDKKQQLRTDFEIKHLNVKGGFAQTEFDIETVGTLFIKQIVQKKNTLLKGKNLDVLLVLEVKGNNYMFKKASVNLNMLALNLNGGFVYSDNLQSVNISYNAPRLHIASALSLLPEEYRKKINDYKSSGKFYANGKLNYNKANNFLFESNFGITGGEITYKPRSTKVTKINVEGVFKYGSKISFLGLNNIRLQLNNDMLSGSCSVRNFSEPFFKLSLEGGLNLENLQNFWPLDTVTELRGRMQAKARVEGSLADLKTRTFSDKVKLDMDVNVADIEIRFKGDEKLYAIENCSVTVKEREIEVQDLRLKRGSSDLKINGKMPGVFNYLADATAPLVIHGNLFSNNLQLEDFMQAQKSANSNTNYTLIPGNVELKLNAAILRFGFAKFEARSVTGELEIKNRKAIISEMKLESMEGEAVIDAFADNSHEGLDVVLQSNLRGINISRLFTEFNNFGQNTLRDKNLKGYADVGIDFSGTWNNKLECDFKSIKANSEIIIRKGELVDFSPLLSLSKYVDLKELQNIKFSDLQSLVEIRNSTIYIPKTSVKNSALNIRLWGTHTFNNVIDYHVELLISELLAKRHREKNGEFGPVENDPENRRSAFILMTGSADNPHIKYDRRGLKEKIKTDVKMEKQSIKQLLKEELGLFKKENNTSQSKEINGNFELEKPAAERDGKEPTKKNEDNEDF